MTVPDLLCVVWLKHFKHRELLLILLQVRERCKARNMEKARARQSHQAAKEARREAEMMVRKEEERRRKERMREEALIREQMATLRREMREEQQRRK